MRYSDSVRRDAADVLAELEEVQSDYQQKADAIQSYIDRLQKILDDEPVD